MDRTVLAELQDLMLDGVLGAQPLPGQDAAFSFPDLAYVQDADRVPMVRQGYVGNTDGLLLVEEGDVGSVAVDGPTGILKFEAPVEVEQGSTIRLRLLLVFPDLEPLPLGEMIATFVRGPGGWTTVPPTHVLAN